MATIKKAQLGGLIKKGVKAATSANKIVIPPGLQRSLNKSKSVPTKLKNVGASEAEKIAHGKKTHLQEKPYDNPKYEKESFLEREVKKTKPKKTTDEYGFDIRPDRNGGTHKKKMRNGGSLSGLKASNKRVGATKMAKSGVKMSKKK